MEEVLTLGITAPAGNSTTAQQWMFKGVSLNVPLGHCELD